MGWAWGVHLYVTLEFAATSRQEAVGAGVQWLRGQGRCARRGGRRSEPRGDRSPAGSPGGRAWAASRSRSSAPEATGTGPERRAPAGRRM